MPHPIAFMPLFTLTLATSILYLLSACSGLPEPGKPVLPETPEKDRLPWFSIYPARWFGNSQAACSVSFDDGTLDQYLIAAPELDARNIRGTFFVITGPREAGYWQDGTTNRLLFSWEQARELRDRGHEIASHTANHVDLRAHPHLAEIELREAYETLRRELSAPYLFSLGWPYWRSSPMASEQARKFHYAARSGGIQGTTGSPQLGGANSTALKDYMLIGSRAILSTDTMAKLAPVFDEVYGCGGWLVPSFHGVDDGLISSSGLGWEALQLETFQNLLDGLSAYGFWFAPFGTVAKYAMQRDGINLEIKQTGTDLQLSYSTKLDPSIFNHPLTLLIELPLAYRLDSVVDKLSGEAMAFHPEDPGSGKRYLVDLPPGDGILLVKTCQEPL